MSIKYNEFGEVVSVNGLTTGQHLGTPMQDAIAEKPEDNAAYGEELGTVTRAENTVDDMQPNADIPANAVVDQSLTEEWDTGFVFNNDLPCQFYGWEWKKYLDGTFTLLGWLSDVAINADEDPNNPLSWVNVGETAYETDLPFDAYDVEVTYWWEGTSENSDFAEITTSVDVCDQPSWLYIEAYASAETRERMRAEGMEDIYGNIYVSITGKWRVDE